MQAIVLEGPRKAVLRELPPPEFAPGDVLVEVERAGICGSDVAVFVGSRQVDYPLIMGHEAVGRVLRSGDSKHAPGTRVVIEPNIPCGTCAVCGRGKGNVCQAKRSLGMNWPGAFAELVAVPSEFAHALPAEVSLDDAVGIEPLAVALHAMRAGQVAEGDRVAVIGCGAEGLLLVQVAAAFGAYVIAADVRQDRLALAQRLGAQALVLVSPEPVNGTHEALCAPIVFEAAGAAAAVELALRVVAPGGRVVALGLASAAAQLLPLTFVRRGLTLVGSLIYDHPTDFQRAIEVVRTRQIQPRALLSDILDGLDALPAALESLATAERGGKIVMNIGAPAAGA